MKRLVSFFLGLFVMFLSISNSYGEEGKKARPPGQEAVLIEKGGVLLPPGTFIFEPGIQYSHTSRTRISISGFTLFEAIVLGRVISEDIKRDLITSFINLRYGLIRNLQIEMKIPWMYRKDREVFTSGSSSVEHTVDENDMGDIEATLSYQIVRERGWVPDIVLTIRGKSRTGKDPYGLKTETVEGTERLAELPTGSGHYGISTGFTFVKSSDPAVLFFNIGYFYNFERDVGVQGGVDYGKVKPGDSIEFGFGMAYALNEKLSTSVSYQQRIGFKTKQNGTKVVNSDVNVGSVYLGISHVVSEKASVNISVGIGLTKDAPDVTVELRIPLLLVR